MKTEIVIEMIIKASMRKILLRTLIPLQSLRKFNRDGWFSKKEGGHLFYRENYQNDQEHGLSERWDINGLLTTRLYDNGNIVQ